MTNALAYNYAASFIAEKSFIVQAHHHVSCFLVQWIKLARLSLPAPGNTKGGSIPVPLTSCLTGLELAV